MDFGRRWMEWSAWEGIELDVPGSSWNRTLLILALGRPQIAWISTAAEKVGNSSSETITFSVASFDGQIWSRVRSVRVARPTFLSAQDPLYIALRSHLTADGNKTYIDLYANNIGGIFKHFNRVAISGLGELENSPGDGTNIEVIGSTRAGEGTALVEVQGNSNFVSSLQLPRPLPAGLSIDASVFVGSQPGKPYWLVPASATGLTALRQTRVWHYHEGTSSCYVDMAAIEDVNAAGISLFPSGVSPGHGTSLEWYQNGGLPSGTKQLNSFSVTGLPQLGTGTTSTGSQESWKPSYPTNTSIGASLFDLRLPNACYEWEVSFHGPMAIADQLSRQQRFQDADRWLRMIFDPLASTAADSQAFLRFRRFRELPRARGVAGDLKTLAKAAASSGSSTPTVGRVRSTIDRWRNQPFRPFVIARQRHVAFLWRTLFAYLDNLMSWADSLYRRETRESIQEALLLYVQVARLLGPRPRRTRRAASRPAASFIDYQDAWDEFANAWLNEIPAVAPQASPVMVQVDEDAPAEGALYFCVPPNERIVSYWDMVEQRLTNIRHCRNIDGVERVLPIEAPEIDLDELVRSVASGASPEEFVADAYAQPWPYRYATLVAQTKEMVNEVKSLGGQLLAAFEKRDAEQLALLRSTHELALLDRVTDVRKLQVTEAERQIVSLRASRDAVAARYEQLQDQLGNEGASAPGPNEFVGTESPLGRLSTGNNYAASNLGLITQEADQLEQLHFAGWWTDADSVARLIAWGLNTGSATANFVSVFEEKVPPASGSTTSEKWAKALGALGSAAASTADGFKAIAQIHQTQASRLAQTAGNIRRRDEWAYQSNQALRELTTMDKQILASEARLDIVRKELGNHELQREQVAATDAYLHDKFTNAALYQWQSSQLLSLYRSTYGLALTMARRARRAAERELAEPLPPIRDHWTNGPHGLLAAERLQREIKLLELSVLEQHARELELTRHISLRRLNPMALIDLITKRSGTFDIPEWLFDLDAPGHYLRRIRSISVTIPCVTGPYAGINAKLTLLRSDTRTTAQVSTGTGYAQNPDEDRRFDTRFHASESIFISSGRDDTGLFESNLRDERYLPFEGAGAISTWRIEFPSDVQQFDRSTISDVIVHVRYTARDAGHDLAKAAKAALSTRWSPTDQPFEVLVSMKTDFSAQWALSSQSNATSLGVELDLNAVLPYWMQAAGVNQLVIGSAIAAIGLRRSQAAATTTFEPFAGASVNADRLSIPITGGSQGWDGLSDVFVVLPVSR